MNSFENYLSEDLLGEDLLENYSEDYSEALRRPTSRFGRNIRPTIIPGVTKPSNFGNNLSGHSADYATKSDLKKALDTISGDVNDLKKSTLATTKSIESLDAKHTEYAKMNARSGDNHKAVLKNMQMMSMMGSILNQPKLNTANLEIVNVTEGESTKQKIQEIAGKKGVEVDQTMSLLLPMLTTMGDSSSGKSDNSNMMLPLILMMTQNKDNSSSNNMLPLVLMMTMMNK